MCTENFNTGLRFHNGLRNRQLQSFQSRSSPFNQRLRRTPQITIPNNKIIPLGISCPITVSFEANETVGQYFDRVHRNAADNQIADVQGIEVHSASPTTPESDATSSPNEIRGPSTNSTSTNRKEDGSSGIPPNHRIRERNRELSRR